MYAQLLMGGTEEYRLHAINAVSYLLLTLNPFEITPSFFTEGFEFAHY